MDKPKKRMGRPKVYPEGVLGAPTLSVRFDQTLWDYVHKQPEGPRQFLESLVREHKRKVEGAE